MLINELTAEGWNPEIIPKASLVKIFPDMTSFQAAGGAAANPGPVWIGPESYNYQQQTQFDGVPDVFDVTFGTSTENLSANILTGGGITASTFANRLNYGTEIGWNAGTVMADGHYVGLFKTVSLNLSSVDNLLFEFGFPENSANTRINIIIGSATNNSRAVVLNGYSKPEVCCISLKKSDFSQFAGTGANWSNVTRIEFRFTSQVTTNPDLRRSMVIMRMAAGGYTKPTVILSHDDIASQLMNELPVIQNRKIVGTHFVTDTEILNSGAATFGKMTRSQIDQWVRAGWLVCAHNIEHKAFSIPVSGYSKTGSTVSLTVDWGSSSNVKENITLVNGDTITLERIAIYSLNGTWTVTGVTQGASKSTITFDHGNTTAIDSRANLDGGVMTINKYNIRDDNQVLNKMIEANGYLSDPEVMAYTYGHNGSTARRQLFLNGVRVCRSTGAKDNDSFLFQPRRKYGLDVFTQVNTQNNAISYNSALFDIPTFQLTTLTNLQTRVNDLLNYGGVLSVYWHGDEPGMTTQIMLDSLNYLADLRDIGQINLITFTDLKNMISNQIR